MWPFKKRHKHQWMTVRRVGCWVNWWENGKFSSFKNRSYSELEEPGLAVLEKCECGAKRAYTVDSKDHKESMSVDYFEMYAP